MSFERIMPGSAAWEVYEPEHRQRYQHAVATCRGLEVLDAACGVGYGSQMLAEAGAKRVCGVDLAEEAISYARRNYQHPSLSFVRQDVERLEDLQMSFDLVVSFETIEHLHAPEHFLRGVRQVLKPGGLFICSTPNTGFAHRADAANPFHFSEMDYQQFCASFSAYFDIEARYHQSHTPAYQRHQALIRELSSLRKTIEFSRLMRFERSLRRLMARSSLNPGSQSEMIARPLAQDYVIEELAQPADHQLVYILHGRPEPASALSLQSAVHRTEQDRSR